MEGVQVLDLSIALTGPYVAALMADQGANVVKVERPGIGDIARWVGVAVNGMSSLYLVCNRGKRSIAVDLQQPEGIDIVLRLAGEADVVLQNFRPGVMDRLGLGYEDVRSVNPEVMYASISGFGPVGPYRDRSAYDTVIQAYAGFAASQADPGDGVPVFLRQSAADKVTALFASQAITAALFARSAGEGASISNCRWSTPSRRSCGPTRRPTRCCSSPITRSTRAFGGFLPIRFTDGWGIVTPTSDHDFAGMCRAFGATGFDDPRVATMPNGSGTVTSSRRSSTCATPWPRTSRWPRPRPASKRERVPFAMILSAEELPEDPHARGNRASSWRPIMP